MSGPAKFYDAFMRDQLTATRERARTWSCARHGHDWKITAATPSGPTDYRCTRCGATCSSETS